MKARRVTIKDVAKSAGVHWVTVSKALKNHPSLPGHTIDRIKKIALEMQYQPDPAMSALVAYRNGQQPVRYHSQIGFITSHETCYFWRRAVSYNEFFKGAAARAGQLGYTLEDVWLKEPGLTPHRLSEILVNRNIRGLIIAPLQKSRGRIRLDWSNFSAITVGSSLVWPPLHRVGNHQFRSLGIAMRQLKKLGYRKMGFVIRSHINERGDRNWSAAFREEQNILPARYHIPPLIYKNPNFHGFQHWLDKHQPELIISHNPTVLEWLHRLKIKVPRQVGFIDLSLQDKTGEIAGIYQNWDVIGRTAIDFLVQMLNQNERGIPAHPVISLIEGSWIQGKTIQNIIPHQKSRISS